MDSKSEEINSEKSQLLTMTSYFRPLDFQSTHPYKSFLRNKSQSCYAEHIVYTTPDP